jgi:Flp pilus assembly protein TadB
MDTLIRVFQHLPRSTGEWTCKWFLTLCYLCTVLAVLAVIAYPGVTSLVGLAVAHFVLGLVLGQRRPSEDGKC